MISVILKRYTLKRRTTQRGLTMHECTVVIALGRSNVCVCAIAGNVKHTSYIVTAEVGRKAALTLRKQVTKRLHSGWQ